VAQARAGFESAELPITLHHGDEEEAMAGTFEHAGLLSSDLNTAGAPPPPHDTSNATGGEKKLQERWTKLLTAASDGAPPPLVPYLKRLAPVASAVGVCFVRCIPLISEGIRLAHVFFRVVPADLLAALFGVMLCFFGGVYPATIAAIEAWQQTGGRQAEKHISDLVGEFQRLMERSSEDDLLDEDGDGIADVDQITARELASRKVRLAITTLDPEKVNGAVCGIYGGVIGVIAVLKIQFARTITLGAAIGDFMYKLALQYGAPILIHTIPVDYHRWIPTLIAWTCKVIAVSIAWFIYRVLIAITSAIRGGLMAARNVLNFMHRKGYIDFDDTESILDEIAGWTIAAVGFYFQLSFGFSPPFPLNIILLPVTFCEWIIVMTIQS